MRLRPYGDGAVMLEYGSYDEAFAWFARLAPHVEAVLGARTVLVRGQVSEVAMMLEGLDDNTISEFMHQGVVEVPVTYDGEDLETVARQVGVSVSDVVALHVGSPWRAVFCGFAPGFVYLSGGSPLLSITRRPEPRTKVRAGAVGLAGEFSAVYPRASPGGWQLIGHTELDVWDLRREQPTLFEIGGEVRFVIAS